MEFIKKKSENRFLLHISVKPNSKEQNIVNNGEYIAITLRSKPIQNRANKELLSLLKKKLKVSTNQIQIISGLKSSNKVLKVTFSEKIEESEILKRILG